MKNDIRKGIEHLSEVAHLALFARKKTVEKIGTFHTHQKRNHKSCRKTDESPRPNRNKINKEKYRRKNNANRRKCVCKFHIISMF